MNSKISYVAIFAVVPKEFTQITIEAAMKWGARGGTIIDAKETYEQTRTDYFINEANQNKEIVMIVIEQKIKNKVLKGIYDTAGYSSGGECNVFTLPVKSIVGINKPNTLQKEKSK